MRGVNMKNIDKISGEKNNIFSLVDFSDDLSDVMTSFTVIFDNLSDAVICLNNKWDFTYINSAAESILQKNRESLIYKDIWMEFPSFVRTLLYEGYHDALMKNRPVEFDEYLAEYDSWWHIQAYPKNGSLIIIFQDITEKHVAMEVVEESYRTLFHKHPDAVCSADLDGNLLAINSAFKKLFPIDEKLLLGSDFRKFLPRGKKNVMEDLFDKAKTGKPNAIELNLTLEAGTPFYILLTAIPIIVQSNIIGVYGIVKDITNQRYNMEKYNEVSHMNKLILDSVDEGILGIDEQNNVVMWNDSAKNMTGYSKEELNIKHLNEMFHQNRDDKSIYPSEGEFPSGESVIRESEVTFFRKDDKPIIMDYVMTPMIYSNRTVGRVYTFRDITEKKKSEEILYQSEKLSAVGQLAAGIAHEIRNPLTSLKGFLQLIEKTGEGKKEYFDIMKSEFGRIEQILNELLILSKPQTTKNEICDLDGLLGHIVTLLNTQAIIKNIYITKDIMNTPLEIEGVSNQIKQVFINFIKNAIEAMDQGEITVKARKEDNFVVIEVIDEGCGIPKSLLSKVGEPFFTTKEKGTGLGLMVSYQIIEDHGGDINVKSEEGEGTTFTIRLPAYEKVYIKQ
ncbi:hypothetical protein CR203_19920 [Salipaludibacillus neizhouensis]|uniref:histidine kinase n=2 Tax=Salipaludibacillus neizhouensis TaxID=885475 RepID=A0A3A9K5F3_9BACI|nr:hypothetical protein CR203_19920 [Salipaludibacillus neizhouensis]